MSKILITGATGHLGSAVANELVEKQGPANVSVLIRNHLSFPEYRMVYSLSGTDKIIS